MIVDYRKQQDASPSTSVVLRLKGSAVWTKFLGVNIIEDLALSLHIHIVAMKACQCIYFLKRLRKFLLEEHIQKPTTGCVTVWYGSFSANSWRSLQRVVELAESITGKSFPTTKDIHLQWCLSNAQY